MSSSLFELLVRQISDDRGEVRIRDFGLAESRHEIYSLTDRRLNHLGGEIRALFQHRGLHSMNGEGARPWLSEPGSMARRTPLLIDLVAPVRLIPGKCGTGCRQQQSQR